MTPRLFAIVVLATFLAIGAASAQVAYLPLAEGNTWSYVAPSGDAETWLVTGQTSLFDQDVWVIEHPVSSENADLENYWTEGADGDVLLHGFWRGFGYAYDPPVMLVDAPLELGKTWFSTFDIYELPAMTYQQSVTMYFEVQDAGIFAVPAGSFEAYGVGYPEPPVFSKRGAHYSLTGERLGPDQRDPDDWWSPGVGEVQYQSHDFFQLESYEVGSVAVQDRTWSGVKSLFE